MPGYLTQTQQTYYSGNTYGGYQYISLDEIIDNFTAAYIGEGKILQNVLKADVSFHAHRALAELTYDTLRSCKSQEIEVCPNLKMPLPQDYVNYVKLTSVDSNGIEHVLYPTDKTSNPFSIEQVQDDCDDCNDTSGTYQYSGGDLKPQELECVGNVTCEFIIGNLVSTSHDSAHHVRDYINANTGIFPTLVEKQAYWNIWFGQVDQYCLCLKNSEAEDNCGTQSNWSSFDVEDAMLSGNSTINQMWASAGWSNLRNPSGPLIYRTTAVNGSWPEITTAVTLSTQTSNTWDNYKGSGSNQVAIDQSTTTNLSVDADNYFQNTGQRYGLEPQYAQANGSFYMDCLKGMIHFSSNLSGKTIILKYISDSLGTDGEKIVPKLAEEAIYKWITYGCLSARAGVPAGMLQLAKRERFAETRKAKIRLSNIKIEEISQILKGQSKIIKH